jgi:hypothetical protein
MTRLWLELLKQRLGLFQVERIESLSEPTIDRGEKIVGLLSFALIAPEPRQVHRCAQLPCLRAHPLRQRDRVEKIDLGPRSSCPDKMREDTDDLPGTDALARWGRRGSIHAARGPVEFLRSMPRAYLARACGREPTTVASRQTWSSFPDYAHGIKSEHFGVVG